MDKTQIDDELDTGTPISAVIGTLRGHLMAAGVSHPAVEQLHQELRRVNHTLERELMECQQAHLVRRNKALDDLVAGRGDLEANISLAMDESDWGRTLDLSPRVETVMKEIRIRAERRAYLTANAAASSIWEALAAQARSCVDRVAAQPAPPDQVLVNKTTAANEAIRAGYADAWAVHVKASDQFAALHKAATVLRRQVGGVPDVYEAAAPAHIAQMFRRWWLYFDERRDGSTGASRRAAVPWALRLRWAVDQGWEPGLWLPHEVPAEPEESRKVWRPGVFRVFGGKRSANAVDVA